ncbi:nuclear transport factor 2 family protein [Labrenzia sp. DG1229]|uniref:nuclear transport factor 2 family protein n=1 Tax=Labrenzia sp. DG1229 TaxID=681847 RepID=UPI00048EAD74|nr:nuclear transport factor 2 family protein [Labrenzia sp. DG1229]
MTSPIEELTGVITDYFDALYHCDTDLLQKVFHPKAVYATADESPLLHRTMEEYVPVVAARVSPASRGEARNDVIEEIQFAGDNAAFARVRCTMAGKAYVDFLTFVREGRRWRIMAKIFQMNAQAEGAA